MRVRAAAALLCSSLTAAPAAAGGELWVARGFGPGTDLSAGMVMSPDGTTVFVAGSTMGDLAVAAYDSSSGATRWEMLRKTPEPYFPHAIAISPDGSRLFVTGDVQEGFFTRSAVTIALEAVNGDLAWFARASAGEEQEILPNAIAVSPDGSRVFVTGARTGTQGVDDFWDYQTWAYDAATGARAWTARYRGPDARADTPVAIDAGPSRVYVTGTSDSDATGRDFATVAYDTSDGSEVWVASNGTGSDDYAAGLVVSPDGSRLYVTGFEFGTAQDFRTVAYEATTGAELGVATFDSGAVDMARAIAISADGKRIYVTGTGGEAFDVATVAYSTTSGQRLWAARYGGSGSDTGEAVAVSADGARVYVAATSGNGHLSCGGDVEGTDYATIAYDAFTGTRVWTARYSGLALQHPDVPGDVAVSPDGARVFVSGISDDGCNASDVATLSYEAQLVPRGPSQRP